MLTVALLSLCAPTCQDADQSATGPPYRGWLLEHQDADGRWDADGFAKHDVPLSHPRLALLDLAYHDVTKGRGLYYIMERRGMMERVVTDDAVDKAMDQPPQTTRARLRGEFIKAAKAKKRDFTVDWVHLKLNDQAQRTVLCKDPFRAMDDRVEKLIASL